MLQIVYMHDTIYKIINMCHIKEPSSFATIVYEMFSTLMDQRTLTCMLLNVLILLFTQVHVSEIVLTLYSKLQE